VNDKLTPAQSQWVESALPRVHRLARSLEPRMPHATYDDLVGAGSEGLIQAALRYDPTGGVPFVTFAHYRIRGAMIDAARRAAPAVRRRTRAMRALQATQSLLERAEAQQPPPAAPDTRSLRERVEAAAKLVAEATTAVVLSRCAPEDPDTVPLPAEGVEENLLERELRAVVREEIDALPEEDRGLLRAIYTEGVSMHVYAQRVDKSPSSVSRRHARLVALLRERIEARFSG
jgi:RNA polymerase sigma factor for flagellar operon FliA